MGPLYIGVNPTSVWVSNIVQIVKRSHSVAPYYKLSQRSLFIIDKVYLSLNYKFLHVQTCHM